MIASEFSILYVEQQIQNAEKVLPWFVHSLSGHFHAFSTYSSSGLLFFLPWAPWSRNCLGSWHAGQGATAHLSIYWAAFWNKSIVGMKCKADRNHFALWSPNSGVYLILITSYTRHSSAYVQVSWAISDVKQSDVCRRHSVLPTSPRQHGHPTQPVLYFADPGRWLRYPWTSPFMVRQ